MNCIYNCSIVFDVLLIIVINGDKKKCLNRQNFNKTLQLKAKA